MLNLIKNKNTEYEKQKGRVFYTRTMCAELNQNQKERVRENTTKKKHFIHITKKNNMMSDHLMSCLENWCVDENYTR